MSDTELLLQEIKELPPDCMDEVLDFVGYLKHKVRPAEKSTAAKHEAFAKTMEEIKALCKDSVVSVDSFLEERHAETESEEHAPVFWFRSPKQKN